MRRKSFLSILQKYNSTKYRIWLSPMHIAKGKEIIEKKYSSENWKSKKNLFWLRTRMMLKFDWCSSKDKSELCLSGEQILPYISLILIKSLFLIRSIRSIVKFLNILGTDFIYCVFLVNRLKESPTTLIICLRMSKSTFSFWISGISF